MKKKAEVNWFIIMAVIALAALLAMMFISGDVFSKFMSNIGWINSDISVKTQCLAGEGDTDNDGDGYKTGDACVDGKKYRCDEDDNDPKKNYAKGDKKSIGTC